MDPVSRGAITGYGDYILLPIIVALIYCGIYCERITGINNCNMTMVYMAEQ